jgi:glycosyltransferase involved in cell wall biosynthesis
VRFDVLRVSVRLAVYCDYAYRRGDGRLWAELPVVRFLAQLAEHLDSVTLVGRLDPRPGPWRHEVPQCVDFTPLPFYPTLSRPTETARVLVESLRRFWHVLDSVDAVWLLGPHPLAPPFAALAGLRGRRVALGVRQDFPAYVRNRRPGSRGLHVAAVLLEVSHLLLARRCPTVVVGNDLARRYRRARRLLPIAISLVTERDIAGPDVVAARAQKDELRLLSVGRLDAEKHPLLLADVLTTLLSRDTRWRLIVAGDGPLGAALAGRLRQLGIAHRAELRGYVTADENLEELYRTSHALLHCSWTEGIPQVLFEAFAARLPVVATAVGGVPEAVGDAALLVAPGDAEAAARALERIAAQPELRDRLIDAGVVRAREHSLEAGARRVAQFLAADARS